jgi:hypothetical protein
MPKLNLPKRFISIQLAFARRMSELSGSPISDTLIDCTNLRTLLNIHVTNESASDVPEWQTFLGGLDTANDADQWAYSHYLEKEKTEPELEDRSCFWYSYPFRDQPKVRLHFSNADRSGHGALSLERTDARQAELIEILTEIHTKHPDAETVRGGSWLYNLDPYCRLFPPEYIASRKPVGYELQFWALWGQFLRGGFRISEEAVQQFLESVERAATAEECEQSFPYEVLRPECDIQHFYQYYEIA